jgi:hypothetical protein
MFKQLLGKKGLTIVAGSILGNMIAERFLLKAGPDDPSGFIMVADGIGMDDVARGLAIAFSAFMLEKVIG